MIASSPEAAGDRLAVALSEMNEAVGRILRPIGAAFQEVFTGIVETITAAATALDNFLGISEGARIERLTAQQTALNIKLGGLQQDLRRAQQETPEASLLGGQGAFGQGPGAVDPRQGGVASILSAIAEAEAERNKVSQQLASAQALVSIRENIKQARPGDGFKPIIPDLSGGTKDGRTPIDTSERMVNLRRRLGEALQQENAELVAQTNFLIRNEKIALRFESGAITAKKQQELLEDSNNQLIRDGLKLRNAAKNGVKDVNTELTQSQQLLNSIKDTVAQGLTNAIMGLVDGTKSLGESLSGILRQLGSMFLNAGFKSLFNFADGGVFQQGKVTPFAYGGVVNKPTLFPMANGAGLMGEAGPEAIMPLRRDRSGRLGVEAVSGGVGNVVVNVDASGSSVEGDAQGANQLGKAIGIAVQAELVKQKRPGGLLA